MPAPAVSLYQLPREHEVVGTVGTGLSKEQIAARLFLSLLTARSHLSRAMGKPAARDPAQLVVLP